MFKSKFFVSSVVFISFLIITATIKNKTRIIEKNINNLSSKVLLTEKNLNEAQLEFFYLTSPTEIENRLSLLGLENYKPIEYSNIYFDISDLINNNTTTSKLKNFNEKKIQKK